MLTGRRGIVRIAEGNFLNLAGLNIPPRVSLEIHGVVRVIRGVKSNFKKFWM
jgi:hypothetical protein